MRRCRPLRCIRPAWLILGVFLISLTAWSQPAQALRPEKERKSTLCGRLVFLEDFETGEKLIGLTPCGKFRPYIFDARPATLHNYYRFYDVVIDSGRTIDTEEYGELNQFILRFGGYDPIESCNACNLKGPTSTPQADQAALSCAEQLLESSAEQLAPIMPELAGSKEQHLAKLQNFATSEELAQKCGQDGSCQSREISIYLGNQLGELFRQGNLPPAELISLLKRLLAESGGSEACQNATQTAWQMIIGLNQQGAGLDATRISSPGTHLALDAGGLRTGFQEDGGLVEQIPESGAVLTGRDKFILSRAGAAQQVLVRGNGFGSMELETIYPWDNAVQAASFLGVLSTSSTRGELNLAEERRTLSLDTHGSGNPELRQPDLLISYPITFSWLPTLTPPATHTPAPPSSTPLPSATTAPPAATATPTAIASPTATAEPETGSPISNLCPLTLGLALAPVAWRARRKKRS